ncbi:MAG: histidine kinase, partial [Bacteroidales bacterium]|nr:histidine kinase [Bacteroidales bacterium]
DTSIKELRRVAHNMMPEALSKFGLKAALNDFCSSIGNAKRFDLNYNYYGSDKRLNSKLEISFYRIAQELINNALKHANASELMIHVVQEDNRIHLTVQDNGAGFDVNTLSTSKGAGIAGIKSRVEALNGRFELISVPGKGTEASVEFLF